MRSSWLTACHGCRQGETPELSAQQQAALTANVRASQGACCSSCVSKKGFRAWLELMQGSAQLACCCQSGQHESVSAFRGHSSLPTDVQASSLMLATDAVHDIHRMQCLAQHDTS